MRLVTKWRQRRALRRALRLPNIYCVSQDATRVHAWETLDVYRGRIYRECVHCGAHNVKETI
jgi:hypothetical protein